MKNVGVIIFTVLVALAATSYAYNSSWGVIGSKDKIIYSKRIFNSTYPYGVTRKVQFPEYKQTNKVKITAVQAVDQSSNKTNSYATLFAGGPGFKYLTMNFQAGTRGNLDYQLIIYGKK